MRSSLWPHAFFFKFWNVSFISISFPEPSLVFVFPFRWTRANEGSGNEIAFIWKVMINRPFAGSGHMVRNKLRWDANNAVGLPKRRNSHQSSPTFLCFESPTALFIPYHMTRSCKGPISWKNPVLHRNAIMLKLFIIQFSLYYLPSGRLREFPLYFNLGSVSTFSWF